MLILIAFAIELFFEPTIFVVDQSRLWTLSSNYYVKNLSFSLSYMSRVISLYPINGVSSCLTPIKNAL